MNELCEQTIAAIWEMPREAFRERVFRGIAKTHCFSELMTFGAVSLPEADQEQIWLSLREAGIPIPCEKIRRQQEPLTRLPQPSLPGPWSFVDRVWARIIFSVCNTGTPL